MTLFRAFLIASAASLAGCASFHTGPQVNATAAIAEIHKGTQGRAATASVSIKQSADPHWGCGDSVIEPTRRAIERSLERAGFQIAQTGSSQYKVIANVTRCDDGMRDGGQGMGQLNLMLSALTLFIVPTWLKSELHVELTVTQAGREIYKGTQSTSGHYLGGWIALPLMLTNANSKWLEGASANVMEKHLVEIDEQGIF